MNTDPNTLHRSYRAAFRTLHGLGVPVYCHFDDSGNFSIDAEHLDASDWVNYWAGYIDDRIENTLRKHKLFAEWVNPGRIAVYTI